MNAPIRLFDDTLTLLAEIDDYESAYFARKWYEYGEFNIVINKNKLYASKLDRGVIVMVAGHTDSVGIITEIEKSVDEGGHGSETIKAKGYEFKYVFNWRNVIPPAGKARYAIPGDVTIIQDTGNPIFNYDFKVSRVMVGSTCHIFYSDGGTVYHRTATDALCHTWSVGAATNLTTCYYPSVFRYGGIFYLIGHFGTEQGSMYIYTSADGITWTVANGGNPVFSNSTGIYTYTWSMSIAVIGSNMYFAVESADDETHSNIFGIAYSWDSFAHLTAGTCNFATNASATHIIANGGSPNLIYDQNKAALILMHSYINYDDVTYWQLRTAWATLTDSGTYWTPSAWTTSNNWGLVVDSINLLYPDFLSLPVDKTYRLLIGYLYDSTSNYQAYFDMTLDEFYDIISANISAETVMKQLVYDQCGLGADSARRIPNMTIATDLAQGDSYVLSARYSKLWDELYDLTYATNLSPSFTVDIATGSFIFDTKVGVDRTATQSVNGRALFSPDFDTLKSADITHSDINFRNLLIVGGKGVGADRSILNYYGTAIEPTGLDRREIFIDAREIDDYALARKAASELETYINEHNYTIDGLEYSQLQYRTDYDVGDICTVYAFDETIDLRLAGATEAWEHGKYTLELEFGKPYPTLTSQTASSQSETDTSLSTTETTASSTTSSGGTSYTTIQIINDELTNINEYPLFANKLSGSVVPHTDSAFTYNPYSGMLSVNKLNQAVIQYQSLKEYTIPGSTNKILQYTNLATGQTSGDVFSIFEIRSPDTSQTESTLSLHNVVSGTDDWVRDISFHNYSGSMAALDVVSHFTGTTAIDWKWVSRYSTGADYDMIERTIMILEGDTGDLIVGEDSTVSASGRGKLDVRTKGYYSQPSVFISIDSSYGAQPSALLVQDGLNYSYAGTLAKLSMLNASDTGVMLRLVNAGTGDYLQADSVFKINKTGEVYAGIWKGSTVLVSYGGTGATSFTAGRLLFGNGTSAINTSANLFWDNGNSYLGLSMTPTERLSVAGNMNQSGNYGIYNNFTSGFAGAGWRVDYGVSTAGKASAEFDNLTIRGTMRVYELIINQIRATNGSLFVSSAAKLKTATLTSGTLGINGSTYTFTTGTSTEGSYHGFLVNDVIRAQRFIWNGTGSAVVYQVNMIVTSVTNLYTFVAQLVGDNSYLTNISVFIGMDFVRLGNTTNTDRQGAVYLTSDDSNSPFIDIVNGITSHADWNTAGKIKARMGRLSGITSATWGTLSGYGLWSENVYLEGAIKATSGYIGAFTIATHLYTGSKTAYNDGLVGVHLGSDGIGLGSTFTVSAAGVLTATSGTIGGWTIGSTLSATNIVLTPGAANTANILVGSGSYSGGLNSGGASSDILIWAGSSYANRASAPFRVSGAGALTATSGAIGGWTIDSTSLYTGTKVASGSYAAAGAITIGSDGHISANQFRIDTDGSAYFAGSIAIGSGNNIFKADSNGIYLGNATFASAPFRVAMDGSMTASNATITGKATLAELVMANVTSGTNIAKASDSEVVSSSFYTTTYTFKKETQFCASGVVNITYDFYAQMAYAGDYGLVALFINGIQIGTDHQDNSATYVTFTDSNIPVSAGDKIQLYIKTSVARGLNTLKVKNLRIKINEQPGILPYIGS